MPWLILGRHPDGALIAIDDAPRGKTELACPYCGGMLTARHGKQVAHHFAHQEQTCAAAKRHERDAPILPAYHSFTLHLTSDELAALREEWDGRLSDMWRPGMLQHLTALGMLEWNGYASRGRGAYIFTKLGKIPVAGLSVPLFASLHEMLLLKRLHELEQRLATALADLDRAAAWAMRGMAHQLERLPADADQRAIDEATAPGQREVDEIWQRRAGILHELTTDIQLYRTQMASVLGLHLYIIAITADGKLIYKIGVTRRSAEERLEELLPAIRAAGGFRAVSGEILGYWPHRGHVERYILHRFADQRHPIGSLTELFSFDARDLREIKRIPKKVLSEVEQAIIAGSWNNPAVVLFERHSAQLQALEHDAKQRRESADRERRRRENISRGLQRAKKRKQVGRPKRVETIEEFLSKEKSQRVLSWRQQMPNAHPHEIAKASGVSINTVRKVLSLVE